MGKGKNGSYLDDIIIFFIREKIYIIKPISVFIKV